VSKVRWRSWDNVTITAAALMAQMSHKNRPAQNSAVVGSVFYKIVQTVETHQKKDRISIWARIIAANEVHSKASLNSEFKAIESSMFQSSWMSSSDMYSLSIWRSCCVLLA